MSTDFDKLILDQAPGGVVITSPNGIVVHWTKGAEAIFGYTVNEVVGRSLHELIAVPGKYDEGGKILQELIGHGIFDYECLRKKKDGSLVYVDVSCKAIYNRQDQIEFVLFSKKDVTHLKALRDAKLIESKFRDLLELTPDGIIMANSTGRIVLANTQAERLFGYAPGELRGQLIEILLPMRFRGAH